MIDARIAVTLPGHPKTKKLIRRLGDGAAWKLICLFLWAASNRPNGDLSGLDDDDIEDASLWDGWRGRFSGALRDVEYIFIENGKPLLDMSMCAPGRVASHGHRICSKTWRRTRAAIFERDDYTCQYCGARGVPLECDHVFPISKGGSNEDDNLVAACVPCNRSKGAKTPEQWRGE